MIWFLAGIATGIIVLVLVGIGVFLLNERRVDAEAERWRNQFR
jgi:hypothetical protein